MDAAVEAGDGPGVMHLVRASVGFLALGAMAGSSGDVSALDDGPVTLVTHLGALALTGPSLLVAHSVLGLRAAPEGLVRALGRTYARTGDLALGLVPFALFFAWTTSIGPQVVAVASLGAGAMGLSAASAGLIAIEASASETVEAPTRMSALVAVWVLLTLAGAARIAWEVSA
ncbi:MAG: hypothetical protein AAGA48_05270 [Myxococcota bacterium]